MKNHTIANRKLRGASARCFIQDALNNPHHAMYTASDVEFAKKLDVSRLTVINIRRRLKLKGRNFRVIGMLQKIDTSKLTIKELAAKLCIKYPNTYTLVRKLSLQTLQDKKPIDCMIEYQRSKNKLTKESAQ
jgi:hypothetical protein